VGAIERIRCARGRPGEAAWVVNVIPPESLHFREKDAKRPATDQLMHARRDTPPDVKVGWVEPGDGLQFADVQHGQHAAAKLDQPVGT
jgi:hypothetical protein